MGKLAAIFRVSFSTKVLVPVVTIMGLLLGLTVWTLNPRITQQFQTEGERRLNTADAFFKSSRNMRRQDLLLRYRNLPKEPRYKKTFQTQDRETIRALLVELLVEHSVDAIVYTTGKPEPVASAWRDPLISSSEFETNSVLAVKHAFMEEEKLDTIRVGDRLFDIVSIPVKGTSDHQIGVLTFGSEIGNASAEDLRTMTQCQIVLLANNKVIASTVRGPDLHARFASLFNDCLAAPRQNDGPKRVVLRDEHYFCSAGKFESLSGDTRLGYLLLSSYEEPLRALHTTQQMLMTVSALGILLGTAIIWLLIRKVTQPLRGLRDSAEAVGRGDFTRLVEVTSRDECGELAVVFNRMTENVKQSREQLESTVETLKTTQAQLVQSEKLSGIGEFVAGVAHELNNPLTSVMGFSELLERANTNPNQKRHLEMIRKSAQRCQKIVQSLLSFARRHQPERKLSNINELVEAAVDFLQYQLRTSNIEVVTRLAPDLPKAMVDPHQIQQVFLNIVNNARQAIEAHQPSGCVRITTEHCGQNARIVLQDNGPGIPEANLSKVFDPFFTTKDVGKGTGLGLSLCYGIIKEHGGTVTVRSKPNQGATFIIELPLAAAPAPVEVIEKIEPLPPEPANRREGAGKKVLVIDDEDAILQMVRETLSEHGYEVDIARDGEAALRRLDKTPYDLALCDWRMPGLSGQQVYERLSVSNPALSRRMIFITGDVINEKAQKFLHDRHKVCLTKPFSLVEFRAAIGKALANL
jgi:signal transduction histidine kinase